MSTTVTTDWALVGHYPLYQLSGLAVYAVYPSYFLPFPKYYLITVFYCCRQTIFSPAVYSTSACTYTFDNTIDVTFFIIEEVPVFMFD